MIRNLRKNVGEPLVDSVRSSGSRWSGLVAASRGPASRRLGAGMLVLASATAPAILALAPASAAAVPAAVTGCSHGLVSATKAWGTCTGGSGSWSLTVQCLAWGANTAYGNGPGSIYATCPSWSHVTSITLNAQQ
jgi:hypothetical protein